MYIFPPFCFLALNIQKDVIHKLNLSQRLVHTEVIKHIICDDYEGLFSMGFVLKKKPFSHILHSVYLFVF